VKVGDDVIARDCAFLQRDYQLSHFQRSQISVDYHAGARDGVGVDFAGFGAESSDQVEMGSGTQVAAVEERSRI